MNTLRLSLLVSLALTGCPQDSGTTVVVLDGASPAPCALVFGVKLGVPFVGLCRTPAPDAFWVAAAPLSCSAGEHETVSCPTITPLLAEPALAPGTLRPTAVLEVDFVTAYRTCALRFGGRLPTPTERAELRRAQGAATAIALADADGRVRLKELDEWTAVGDCGNPSRPGAGCAFARYPGTGDIGGVDWSRIRHCEVGDAPPGTSADSAVGFGEACPDAARCIFRSPWFGSASAPPRLLVARCTAPESTAIHPPPAPDVAAFRCVLPQAAVTPSR